MFRNIGRLLKTSAVLSRRAEKFLLQTSFNSIQETDVLNVKNIVSSKYFSTSLPRCTLLVERLDKRSLVKLSGSDVPNFLQGLVTNDVQLLVNSVKNYAIYCMMLNTQGRILYDLLLYKVNSLFEKDCSIIVECDSRITDDLISTMTKYKLRKKVISFTKLDNVHCWSVFPKSSLSSIPDVYPIIDSKALELKLSDEKVLFCSPDPRISFFGHRLLLPSNVAASDVIEGSKSESGAYEERRYDFGLGEGVVDIPPSQSFPLEANLYFLNGVSFSKGCYIGQELTARTHHTGVIRKRLLPIFSRSAIILDNYLNSGSLTIYCESAEKECGKIRSWNGKKGIALLRLHEAILCPGPLTIRGLGGVILGQVETFVPQWWPKDGDEIIRQVMAKQDKI